MGFLAHRKASIAGTSCDAVGPVTVFFGCRHRDHDWLYREELQAFQNDNVISNLYTAFSRDNGEKKEYVQDAMKSDPECSKHVVDTIINGNSSIYICGDGFRMARDVQQAISELIGPHVNDSAATEPADKGRNYIEKMKSEGRFMLDIWT
jgi:cytochrome P450/NADPH-cytochrome P450 reductase